MDTVTSVPCVDLESNHTFRLLRVRGFELSWGPGAAQHFSCQCRCGRYVSASDRQLLSGSVWACPGCMKGSVSRWPEYRAWWDMHRRCTDPRNKSYRHYGGRGIRVAPSWSDFWCFLDDVGRRPFSDYSLDRIDVDGSYEPGNVRWADASTQRRNQRRYIERERELLDAAPSLRFSGAEMSRLDPAPLTETTR